MRLVLASASPRRRDLLSQLGVQFTVRAADIDERPHLNEAPRAYVERLAREKAAAIAAPDDAVLAADTSVVANGSILGKPGDDAVAGARMLRELSGRTHSVMTGIAVAARGSVRSCVVETAVTMRSLTDAEVRWYVATGEGHDKAGGYALQGRAGAFITAINGSTSSVVGLPLAETCELLTEAGFALPWMVP